MSTNKNLSDPFEPLWDRAISRGVAEARGYIPYYGQHHPLYNPTALRAALDRYPMSRGQRDTLMKFARDARDAPPPKDTFLRFAKEPAVKRSTRDDGHDGHGMGLLMLKHPAPGEPDVLPQLRPEHPVRTGGTTWHRHDEDFLDNPDGLAKHIREEHAGAEDFPADRHHEHEDFAKYLLVPNEKEDYWHDHAADPAHQGPGSGMRLRDHIRADHPCQLPGPHGEHRCRRKNLKTRHSHRRDKDGQHVADRLDIHPLALERLIVAERVYFVIEGTPKADAILSQIIDARAPASVFDVPSVTLWDAPELNSVAQLLHASTWYLRWARRKEKQVVVVCDADWFKNDAVVRQALFCREFLRKRGVTACVAAPPICDGQGIHADCVPGEKCKRNGVDDFLAAGGDLDDLVVVDREALFWLALYANKKHEIRGSITTLAKLLGCRKDADVVLEKLRWHINAGAITSDRELAIGLNEYTGQRQWAGPPKEWPTFTIREDLRHEQSFSRLGDYRPRPIEMRDDIYLRELAKARLRGEPAVKQGSRAAAATAEQVGVSIDAILDTPSVKALLKGERQVLKQMAKWADGAGVPKRAIAQELNVSVKTVTSYADDADTPSEAPMLLREVERQISDPIIGAQVAELLGEIFENYPVSLA